MTAPLMTGPYPDSFGGNPYLYAGALGAITAAGIMSLMVAGWQARDVWRDRYILYPTHSLMILRLICMLMATASFLRALPEAVYLFYWNDVSEATMYSILAAKRWSDIVALIPALMSTTLLVCTYPSIAHTLRQQQQFTFGSPLTSWPRLARPFIALVLVFIIAGLVSVGKLQLG